jgi:hypothetical protein
MKKTTAVVSVLAFAALAAPALSSATSVHRQGATVSRLTAQMDARQVVPSKPKGNVAHAVGDLAGTLTGTGAAPWKLSWQVTYSRLDSPSIVIADIHYGKPGKFGPIIVRLCGPCKPGQKGVTKLKATWVPAIKSGSAFITLITGENPNGEIRGQITSK